MIASQHKCVGCHITRKVIESKVADDAKAATDGKSWESWKTGKKWKREKKVGAAASPTVDDATQNEADDVIKKPPWSKDSPSKKDSPALVPAQPAAELDLAEAAKAELMQQLRDEETELDLQVKSMVRT